jgi:hypothetical protein
VILSQRVANLRLFVVARPWTILLLLVLDADELALEVIGLFLTELRPFFPNVLCALLLLLLNCFFGLKIKYCFDVGEFSYLVFILAFDVVFLARHKHQRPH